MIMIFKILQWLLTGEDWVAEFRIGCNIRINGVIVKSLENVFGQMASFGEEGIKFIVSKLRSGVVYITTHLLWRTLQFKINYNPMVLRVYINVHSYQYLLQHVFLNNYRTRQQHIITINNNDFIIVVLPCTYVHTYYRYLHIKRQKCTSALYNMWPR